MKLISITVIGLLLSGCATDDYTKYADGQAKVDQAKYTADAARYKALSDIAASGDTTARVAAVVALAINNGGGEGGQTKLQAPPQSNSALQWASILVPGVTSVMGMRYNYLSNVASSNNSRLAAESTNNTFLGIASKIQSPAGTTTTNVMSGTGIGNFGSGAANYSLTDRHDTTDRHDSTVSTLSGTGALGGSYSPTDNHTVTPAPVVTPVVQVVPTVVQPSVITPVVVNSASGTTISTGTTTGTVTSTTPINNTSTYTFPSFNTTTTTTK